MSKRPSLASNMKALAENTAPDPVRLVTREKATPTKTAASSKRAEMKKMLIPVDASIHRKLKMLAAQEGTTLEEVCRAALSAYVEKHG